MMDELKYIERHTRYCNDEMLQNESFFFLFSKKIPRKIIPRRETYFFNYFFWTQILLFILFLLLM